MFLNFQERSTPETLDCYFIILGVFIVAGCRYLMYNNCEDRFAVSYNNHKISHYFSQSVSILH